MPRAPIVATTASLASAVAWALVLVFSDGTFAESSAALLAIDLVVVTTVGVVGLTVARSRWARRLLIGLLLVQLLGAFEVPVGWGSAIALAVTVIGLVSLSGPWLNEWAGSLPRTNAPPATAVALTLGVLLMPGWIAILSPQGLTVGRALLAAACFPVAWAYGRALGIALWVVRLAFLPAAVLSMIGSAVVTAVAISVYAAGLVILAWTADARIAVEPTEVRPGTAFPIPPDLTPSEILSAARLDRQGRPHPEDPR
jgi:hypothetical protein